MTNKLMKYNIIVAVHFIIKTREGDLHKECQQGWNFKWCGIMRKVEY